MLRCCVLRVADYKNEREAHRDAEDGRGDLLASIDLDGAGEIHTCGSTAGEFKIELPEAHTMLLRADDAEGALRWVRCLARLRDRRRAAHRGRADAPLPDGWVAHESASHPGQLSYENVHTGEKIGWFPTEKASAEPGNLPQPTPTDMAFGKKEAAANEARHKHDEQDEDDDGYDDDDFEDD